MGPNHIDIMAYTEKQGPRDVGTSSFTRLFAGHLGMWNVDV